MKHLFLLLILWCNCFTFVRANSDKSAITLLEKCAQVFQNSAGIESKFLMKEFNASNKLQDSFKGHLYSKGNKFVIDIPSTKIWFNGKDQWALVKDSKEVNWTSPTPEEIQAVNPIQMLRLYKCDYSAFDKGTVQLNGKSYSKIELKANQKNASLQEMILLIHKTNCLPYSLTIKQNNKSTTQIIFENINNHINLPDSLFVFNKQMMPDVEIIDLR